MSFCLRKGHYIQATFPTNPIFGVFNNEKNVLLSNEISVTNSLFITKDEG